MVGSELVAIRTTGLLYRQMNTVRLPCCRVLRVPLSFSSFFATDFSAAGKTLQFVLSVLQLYKPDLKRS